jgi:hypothetical protein
MISSSSSSFTWLIVNLSRIRRKVPVFFIWEVPHFCDWSVCTVKFSGLFCLFLNVGRFRARYSCIFGFFLIKSFQIFVSHTAMCMVIDCYSHTHVRNCITIFRVFSIVSIEGPIFLPILQYPNYRNVIKYLLFSIQDLFLIICFSICRMAVT